MRWMDGRLSRVTLAGSLMLATAGLAGAQQGRPAPETAALGSAPSAAAFPHVVFAFEFQIALSPAVVVGDTPYGHRQYIPILGGRIAGPKLSGEVLAGGWDYQLGLANGCSNLSADYFIRAQDRTLIHVLNEGMFCPPTASGGARSFFRPRFEAPKGQYEWLTRSTFVASLEIDPSIKPAGGGSNSGPGGIRLKFYQVE